MLRLGRYRLSALRDGTFALDGGSLFGIVPRPRWSASAPPDPQNRVRLAVRCLLAEDDDGRRILVDGGVGPDCDPGWVAEHGVERGGGGLDAGLSALGLGCADITDVVLTHLHLEHSAGTVRQGAGGRPELAFPRATVHVQRRNWQAARIPTALDGGGLGPVALDLMAHSGQLHLVDGEVELFPDFEVVVSEGHAAGQQLPRLHGGGTHLTCCGDLIPTAAHLVPAWNSAFDVHPLTTAEEKRVVLAEALEDDGILAFGHDPALAACRLSERDGEPTFREAVAL